MKESQLTINKHLAEKIKQFRPYMIDESYNEYLELKYVFKYLIDFYVPKANYKRVMEDLSQILSNGSKPISNKMVENILNVKEQGRDFMSSERLNQACKYFGIKKIYAVTNQKNITESSRA